MVHAPSTLTAGDVDQLRRSLDGDIVTPNDATYDDARRLWNAINDRRPAVIARPASAAGVATAIRFGRDRGLELAVRAGGHSVDGIAGLDGGLVVDLTAMRGVEVDPESRLARAQGGALLGELDVAAQAHGLVCPVGVVGHTGAAGLTLGGGIGRLQRRFGLTIDNLASVELVTADGRIIRASETEEPELFWGIRGAGWNFGIVTAFEFRLHPFGPDLHRGTLMFPGSQVQDAWAVFREYTARAPETVSIIFGIDRAGTEDETPASIAGKPIAYIGYNHSGAAETVERDTAGLYAGPKPAMATIGSRPYLDVQTAHDLVLGWGNRSYIYSANANDIRADALDELVEHVATTEGEGTLSATALGGAIGRVDDDATAYTGRVARFDVSADITWRDPARDDTNRSWARRAVALALTEPDPGLGRFVNGNSDAGPEQSRLYYGDAKVARLAALKRTWDPDNVFHVNHNVAPAGR